MPLFRAKKEVFEWVKTGKKTIDLRKGKAHRGEIAFFVSGPHTLKLKIVNKQTDKLENIVQNNNFKLIIPSAETVVDAVLYMRKLYDDYDGFFTAYHLAPLEN